jgi:hypothetical protein
MSDRLSDIIFAVIVIICVVLFALIVFDFIPGVAEVN